MIRPRPQTLQEESVAEPGTHPLIILSLVWKSDQSDKEEVHGKSSHLFCVFQRWGKKGGEI